MTLVKIKSLIYRFTGIYLATKEEHEHITSQAVLDKVEKQLREQTGDDDPLTLYELIGIEQGMWNIEHGFTRVWVPYRGFNKKIYKLKYSKNVAYRLFAGFILFFIEMYYNIRR